MRCSLGDAVVRRLLCAGSMWLLLGGGSLTFFAQASFGGQQGLSGTQQASLREQQQDPLRFSLQESMAYALENNARIQERKMEIARVEKENLGRVARGLPAIDLRLDYNYNIEVQKTILPDFLSPIVYDILEDENLLTGPKKTEFGVAAAQFGTTYSGVAGLSLSQLLFDANYFLALKAVRLHRALVEDHLAQSQIELKEQCAKAYYLSLVTDKQHALSEQNYRQTQNLLKEMTALYANGFVEEIDVERMRINAGMEKVALRRARDAYRLSTYVLKLHMGLDQNTPIVLTDTLSETDFARLIARTRFDPSRRVEYNRMSLAGKLAHMDIKSQRAQLLPVLDFQLRAGMNMGANQFSNSFAGANWFPYALMGITLKWPILSIGSYARIQQKKIAHSQIEKQRVLLTDNLTLEYARSRMALESAMALLDAQKNHVKTARLVYQTTREKYRQGVGSSLEIDHAMNTLKRVETQYYNALYEALSAKVSYEKACGLL